MIGEVQIFTIPVWEHYILRSHWKLVVFQCSTYNIYVFIFINVNAIVFPDSISSLLVRFFFINRNVNNFSIYINCFIDLKMFNGQIMGETQYKAL